MQATLSDLIIDGQSVDHPNQSTPSSQCGSDNFDASRRDSGLRRRRLQVIVYVLALTLLHADYNLLAPNLTQVADDFGMDNDERDTKLGGQIALSFFLFGVPTALLVGWLADMVNRRAPIFATVVMIGEISCFSTYFVKSFTGLMVTRTINGMAIGGSLPVIYSVLGDLYQAEGRNAISGLVTTAVGLGLGVGQAIAGYIGPSYGWRLPFLIVSVPSFFVGVASFFLPEPDRGSQEEAVLDIVQNEEEQSTSGQEKVLEKQDEEGICSMSPSAQIDNRYQVAQRSLPVYMCVIEKPTLKTTCEMLKTPTLILLLLQGAPSVVPFGIASVFLNDFLAQEKGLTTEQATSVLLTFGVGNAIGVILGSLFGHLAYMRDVRLPAVLMGISIILSCIPMYFVINMSYDHNEGSVVTASVLVFLAGLLSIFPIPIERAILANTTLPETRGRANSFLNIVDDLGKGLGPFLLSKMISSLGRRLAFSLSLIGWLVGGAICLAITFFVKNDEKLIQDKIRNKIHGQLGENGL